MPLNNEIVCYLKRVSKKIKIGKVCFVGCGRGHDAVYFAKQGFDVTAVDFSSEAIKDLKGLSKKASVFVNCIQEDIFTFFERFSNYFDYIIEQTCFCAIHPSRRSTYEIMARSILKPKGSLIGLWFPLDKKVEAIGMIEYSSSKAPESSCFDTLRQTILILSSTMKRTLSSDFTFS